MPPAKPVRRDGSRSPDEVDQHIQARRRTGALQGVDDDRGHGDGGESRGNPGERARARELLVTDFFWSDLATTSRRAKAPSAELLTRAWDDAIDAEPTGRGADLRPRHREARPELVTPEPEHHSALRPSSVATTGPGGEPVRRTIVITGRHDDRYVTPRRGGYDSQLRPHERAGYKPDRLAMWAVLLSLALLLGAATSSHAAVLHAALHVTR